VYLHEISPDPPVYLGKYPIDNIKVFMTCKDTLSCVHEPFGDAWYFGPERLNPRYSDEVDSSKERDSKGFSNATYRDTFESLDAQEKKEV
jgi:hypothetical protein